MISLLIEDVEVDVLQTEQIVTEYSVAPIGDISKRTGARSIQFKLPRTAKNRAVFEASELPISTSAKPYQRLKARLYVDGVDMNILFATLESVKDYYFIRVYGSNVDFFNIIKDSKLADLNLNDLNHHWDFLTVRNSRLNTDGYIYPLINWNVGDVVGDTAREQCFRLLVSVYAETLLQRICSQNGYTLNNLLLNDSDYTYAKIVVPSGTVDYERDLNANKYISEFRSVGTQFFIGSAFPSYYEFNCVTYAQNEIYFVDNDNVIGSMLYFPQRLTFDYEISFTATNVSSAGATNAQIRFTRDSFTTLETTFDFTLAASETRVITTSGSFDTFNFPNALNPFAFKALLYSGLRSVDVSGFILKITNVECINKTPILFDNGVGRESVKNYVTVANLLPDLKQSDFLKNFLQLHGAIVQVNEQTKVVTIAKFEQVLNNLSSAVDWTGKLDFVEEYETKFQLDYAQNNYLRYKDEDGVIKPEGTDSNLTVADENLEFEKDFITLDFGATESDVWFTNGNNAFNYNTPNIPVLVDGLVEETTEPRLLYLKQIDGYTHTYRDGASQFDVNTSAPIAWFIDDDFSHSLGFGSDLYERYYSFLEGILDRTKVIEAKIRLNTSDIAQLDFLKPVYIGELDAHFYVSKVKFDYTSNASSIVELVKLL